MSQSLWAKPKAQQFCCGKTILVFLSKMSVIAKGAQGKPGLTFWVSFHFFVSYFDPLSLWQKPRLVALIWKFHRKMTRSFFGRFPAFWPGSAAGPRALGLFLWGLWACQRLMSLLLNQSCSVLITTVQILQLKYLEKCHFSTMWPLSPRESLSSYFDLVFCSWALIWAQKAQAKSLGL